MRAEVTLKRTGFGARTSGLKATSFKHSERKEADAVKRMKTSQRAVTALDKALWNRLAALGCIACRKDGNHNPHVSIHHIDGRTKPGCHQNVLPLCAGHHQDGTGEDKSLIAVHPWKAQFESRYGAQNDLLAECIELLEPT